MKNFSSILAATLVLLSWSAGGAEVECFTPERIKSETIRRDKHYSPEFVQSIKDGVITMQVKRVPGGPVGGMVAYAVTLNQKTAAPFTIAVEGRTTARPKKPYGCRIDCFWRDQRGRSSGWKYNWFTPVAQPYDGKWHPTVQTYNPGHPVMTVYIHVAFCYQDGEAQFRNISIKTASSSLRALPKFNKAQLPVRFSPQDVYAFNDQKNHAGQLFFPVGHPAVTNIVPQEPWQGVHNVRMTVELPSTLTPRVFANPQATNGVVELKSAPPVRRPHTHQYAYTLDSRTWRRQGDHLLYLEGDAAPLAGQKVQLKFFANQRPAGTWSFTIVPCQLPAIRYPKNFPLFGYYLRGVELSDPALSERNAQYCETLGIRHLLSPRNYDRAAAAHQMLQKRGWWISSEIGWSPYCKLQDRPENLCRNEKGQAVQQKRFYLKYCPSYLIAEFKKHRHSVEISDKIPYQGIYLDFEPYCRQRLLSICRCPRCLKQFSQFSGIDRRRFTAQNVEEKFYAPYLEFRKKQHAQLVQSYTEMFTSRGRKPELVFCSQQEHINTDNSFSLIRNQLYEKFARYLMPMTYYRTAKLFDSFRHNAKSTRGAYLPMIYSMSGRWIHDWNTPEEFALGLVAAWATGAQGLSFFCNADFDGRYAQQIMTALDNIAAVEKFPHAPHQRCDAAVKLFNNHPLQQLEVDGQQVQAPAITIENVRHTAHRRGGEILVALFNFDPVIPAELRVALPQLPDGTYTLQDPATGHCYFDGSSACFSASALRRGVPFSVPVKGYRLVVVQPQGNLPLPSHPAAAQFQLPIRRTQKNSTVQEKRLNSHGMSISRTHGTRPGQYAVRLETPLLKVDIELENNGQIGQLYSKKLHRNFCRPGEIGLMHEVFDRPGAQFLGAPYQVRARRISANFAEVELEAVIRHGQLKNFTLKKRYRVYKNTPQIDTFYRIEVHRDLKAQADFQMRIKNRPDFGLPGQNLAKQLSIAVPQGGKMATFTGPYHVAWGEATGLFRGILSNSIKGKFDRPEFTLRAPGAALQFSCPPAAPVTHIFSWREQIPTAEIFYALTDFDPDPHRLKVWESSVRCQLLPATDH